MAEFHETMMGQHFLREMLESLSRMAKAEEAQAEILQEMSRKLDNLKELTMSVDDAMHR